MCPFPVRHAAFFWTVCGMCLTSQGARGWSVCYWGMLVPMEKNWHTKRSLHVEDKKAAGLCAAFALSAPVSIFLAWVISGTPLAALFVIQAVLAPVEVAVSAWCAFSWVPKGK